MSHERNQIIADDGRPMDAHFNCWVSFNHGEFPHGVFCLRFHARGGGQGKATNHEYGEGLLTICRRLLKIQRRPVLLESYIDSSKTRDSSFDWKQRFSLSPMRLDLGDYCSAITGHTSARDPMSLRAMLTKGQRRLGSNDTRAITLELDLGTGFNAEHVQEFLRVGPASCSTEVFWRVGTTRYDGKGGES